MLQREVAERLGVCAQTAVNWESNAKAPELRCMPAVIRLLGSNPLPDGNTLGEWLVLLRKARELPQKEFSRALGFSWTPHCDEDE